METAILRLKFSVLYGEVSFLTDVFDNEWEVLLYIQIQIQPRQAKA
jgi:hypothetical protein